MPTRLIHESLCTSESVARCSPRAQDAFPRMVLYADNFGVFQVNPVVMKGRLWPLRKDVSPKDIEKWLAEYERQGMLERFDQAGKQYGYFVSWPKFQRIRNELKRQHPAPPNGVSLRPAAGCGDSRRLGGSVQEQFKAVAGTDTKAVAVRKPTPPLSPRGGTSSMGQILKTNPALNRRPRT